MALLLVRIENRMSLPLNEFYDYNGTCYGLSRDRRSEDENCINMEEFYDASVGTGELSGIPVVFVCGGDAAGDETSQPDAAGKSNAGEIKKSGAEELQILGWYRKALISDTISHPAFFLEGNIRADAADAVLLPENSPLSKTAGSRLWMRNAAYEVVEKEDSRYPDLIRMMDTWNGKNAFLRYAWTHITLDAKVIRNYELCMNQCQELAGRVMNDECEDIRDIKALELYAKEACSLKRKDPDGYYYHAMACYQLGFLRQGLKSIGKALELDPDAADLTAQKALLLTSRGYRSQAAALFQEAFEASGDESYLLWEGKTWLLDGQADKGYECFRRIENKALLDEAGIVLKDMEKKWPFMGLRGFKLRNLFHK